MVSGDAQRRRQAGENARAVVRDDGGLAMDGTHRTNDVAAVCGADALVAETDAENRCRGPETAHDPGRYPGFGRRAGSRGDDDVARAELLDLVQRQRIVAADDRVPAELAHITREVVHERVVIIDEQNHTGAASASIMPRALSSVSRYSCSGFESAMIPPPALKYRRSRSPGAITVLMAMLVSSAPVTLQ